MQARTQPRGKAKQYMWAYEKLLQTSCCMGIKGLGKRQSRVSLWRAQGHDETMGERWGGGHKLLIEEFWLSLKSHRVWEWKSYWKSWQKEESGTFTIKVLTCVRGEATSEESGLTYPALMKILDRSFQKMSQENSVRDTNRNIQLTPSETWFFKKKNY